MSFSKSTNTATRDSEAHINSKSINSHRKCELCLDECEMIDIAASEPINLPFDSREYSFIFDTVNVDKFIIWIVHKRTERKRQRNKKRKEWNKNKRSAKCDCVWLVKWLSLANDRAGSSPFFILSSLLFLSPVLPFNLSLNHVRLLYYFCDRKLRKFVRQYVVGRLWKPSYLGDFQRNRVHGQNGTTQMISLWFAAIAVVIILISEKCEHSTNADSFDNMLSFLIFSFLVFWLFLHIFLLNHKI